MSKIEIFEAAGCCATSSVVVSDEAVKWNASAEWAKKHGVDIQRYSLAKNPQQFLNTPVIKEFLNTSGMESLPVTLLDGKLVMAGKLPTREDIARWAGIPLLRTGVKTARNHAAAAFHVCLNSRGAQQ
jgi:hypothetical protein